MGALSPRLAFRLGLASQMTPVTAAAPPSPRFDEKYQSSSVITLRLFDAYEDVYTMLHISPDFRAHAHDDNILFRLI